jgi:hypothetical protein
MSDPRFQFISDSPVIFIDGLNISKVVIIY